jgi:hypothetical protein
MLTGGIIAAVGAITSSTTKATGMAALLQAP